MKYALVISIVISVLTIAALTIVGINYYTNSISSTAKVANKSGANLEETNDPTALAIDVKTQVDLMNIQTSLAIYFSEYGYYPVGLQELLTGGYLNEIDLNGFIYQRCDGDTVVVTSGSSGFKLDSDRQTSELSC